MDSESNVKHGRLQAAGAIRHSQLWCFSVAGLFWGWASFLQKATLSTGGCRLQSPSALHSHGVSVWQVGFGGWANFLWVQKATLSTGGCRPQAPSVLHCHGASMWRGVRCGSLGNHFGVHFLWLQKATLGTTSCRPQAPSVLHCHGVLVWRVQPFWSQFLVDSESDVRHDQLQAVGATKSSIPSLWGRRQGA